MQRSADISVSRRTDDEYRTVYYSGVPEFTPGYSRVRVTRSLGVAPEFTPGYSRVRVTRSLGVAPEFTPGYSRVRVTRSLGVCVVDRCLSFCTFSFGNCVVLFFDLQILIASLVS